VNIKTKLLQVLRNKYISPQQFHLRHFFQKSVYIHLNINLIAVVAIKVTFETAHFFS